VPPQKSSFSCVTGQKQPQNWYPTKKKVKVPHLPSQILQCPKPNVVPSFWCKICKVDCVTEFNFSAHVGGKKHKAKKLEILGTPGGLLADAQAIGAVSGGQSGLAVSGADAANKMWLVALLLAGPNCDMSSESGTNGAEGRGCTVQL
jgi:hypothetical protein